MSPASLNDYDGNKLHISTLLCMSRSVIQPQAYLTALPCVLQERLVKSAEDSSQ